MIITKADKFASWGVTADELYAYRSKIKNLTWLIPTDLLFGGQKGIYGGRGSGAFHHELGVLIDNSQNLQEFHAGLIKLAERWSIINIPLIK
ncbi:hypothetical protein [Moraxella marmotae]|uniref:hypothetical protein n=1 Tax=Moraxella marmotae TaxID=3344520 RepID=UPI0035D4FDF9